MQTIKLDKQLYYFLNFVYTTLIISFQIKKKILKVNLGASIVCYQQTINN